MKKYTFHDPNISSFMPIPNGISSIAKNLDGKKKCLEEVLDLFKKEADKHKAEVTAVRDRNCIIYKKPEAGYLLVKYY